MADDGRAPTSRRVVMFPLPFRSHITPMLQLAGLLRARGLGVTVLHTDFNAPDAAQHPEFTFVSIRESLPEEVVAANADMVEQMVGLNTACEAPFQAALRGLLHRQEPRDVACVVVDGQWYAMLGAARRAGVPALVLRADSAATFLSMLATPRLCAAGYFPIEEERLDELVPGLEPLRVRDLIRVDGSDEETVLRFITLIADAMRASSSGVVLNTFDALEAPELAKIERELSHPAFAVGPLHMVSPAAVEHGLHAPDRGCLAWLDAHPPRSVLYVSLGSVARVDRSVFEEMAWGLASSSVPFLWVVRPGFVRGVSEDVPQMPDGVNEEVRNRGKVVAWAPQREVLAHTAIGAFWTHCGWNSTMETICEGVPMLAQPCFADQTVNARYVTRRWGIGLQVGEVFERATVAKAITRLMDGEQGAHASRERARLLKMQTSQCIVKGGSASLALDNLVDYMVSLSFEHVSMRN
ncbi:DIMBOA UDP-glucosyltransferase BX8-like [Phragmites australis]|uniref:DIMBOA UDP-glucosyltransferase BX8-like n=1 Tax=Phragmites australis TaxID=29695 RepID=UPI002D76DA26|nr:DIMBOA UDP-glucosyltransferase BX8-like [Phragmites australis]